LLAGMDLSLWSRVRKLFVDWGYRGGQVAIFVGFSSAAQSGLMSR
jgi:hypothetical protein